MTTSLLAWYTQSGMFGNIKLCGNNGKFSFNPVNFNLNNVIRSITQGQQGIGRFLQPLACTTQCDNYSIIDFKIK